MTRSFHSLSLSRFDDKGDRGAAIHPEYQHGTLAVVLTLFDRQQRSDIADRGIVFGHLPCPNMAPIRVSDEIAARTMIGTSDADASAALPQDVGIATPAQRPTCSPSMRPGQEPRVATGMNDVEVVTTCVLHHFFAVGFLDELVTRQRFPLRSTRRQAGAKATARPTLPRNTQASFSNPSFGLPQHRAGTACLHWAIFASSLLLSGFTSVDLLSDLGDHTRYGEP